jgi:hypothetical protein
VAIRTIRVEISFMTPGRPGRVGVNVHFRAISCRCHRRIVSGVTMVATCRKTRRPRRWPFAARRRRWSSVSRRRRPFSCPLRTRFSSIRYSMTCCWWRLTHPARVTSSTCKGRHQPSWANRTVPHTGPGNGVRAGRVFGHYGRGAALRPRTRPRRERERADTGQTGRVPSHLRYTHRSTLCQAAAGRHGPHTTVAHRRPR